MSRKLHAGTARVEITLREDGVAVNDPLYAKALVFDDGRTRLALVSLDAVAIGGIADVTDDFLPALRLRVARETGIPAEHVLVNASHTHPANRLVVAPDLLPARVGDCVRSAWERRAPAVVAWGRGREDRIAVNRTLELKDGGLWTVRRSIPSPPDEEVAAVRPCDPDIGVLRVDDAGDGRPLALWWNFACHPLIGVPSGAVTAGFPGFASRVIEENMPGVNALFFQGAAGDATELLYKDTGRPLDAEPLGTRLGLAVLRAARGLAAADARLSVIPGKAALPRRADFGERLAEARAEQARLCASLRFMSLNFKGFLPLYLKQLQDPAWPGDYSYRYLQERATGSTDMADLDRVNRRDVERYRENIRAMEKLSKLADDIATLERHREINRLAGMAPFEAEVTGVRIGEFALLASPLELLTEIGLSIKRASPHPYTFVAGFTNGYGHYGPPAGDYGRGGYETTECFLAPEWRALFEEKAGAILNRL